MSAVVTCRPERLEIREDLHTSVHGGSGGHDTVAMHGCDTKVDGDSETAIPMLPEQLIDDYNDGTIRFSSIYRQTQKRLEIRLCTILQPSTTQEKTDVPHLADHVLLVVLQPIQPPDR